MNDRSQKQKYCRSIKGSLFEIWEQYFKYNSECVKQKFVLSQQNKLLYFNTKFQQSIMPRFINNNPNMLCDESMIEKFIEWMEQQPELTREDILFTLEPKTSLLLELMSTLNIGRTIQKKILDRYNRAASYTRN